MQKTARPGVAEAWIMRRRPQMTKISKPIIILGTGRCGSTVFHRLLARHRADSACSACHNLMDPIGLGLENFDWMGRWRDTEADGTPIEAIGT